MLPGNHQIRRAPAQSSRWLEIIKYAVRQRKVRVGFPHGKSLKTTVLKEPIGTVIPWNPWESHLPIKITFAREGGRSQMTLETSVTGAKFYLGRILPKRSQDLPPCGKLDTQSPASN